MVNASFLKRSEIAVRFLKTSKRSENRRKSIQLLDVSGREGKIKTSMNTGITGGCAAQKCCMLRSQRVATKISIYA